MELTSFQKAAIRAQGNTVLSAGAGSGKTFVIIENILFRIQEWIESQGQHIETRKVQSFLRKQVLMTFTTKAAGEIRSRLKKRVLEKALEDPQWKLISAELESLFVGTIHSFCWRLLSYGIFPGESKERYIMEDQEFDYLMNRLVEEWFEKNLTRPDIDQFIRRKKDLMGAIKTILSSADLRLVWDKKIENEMNWEEFCQELREVLKLDLLGKEISFDQYSNYQGKSWYSFYREFFEFLHEPQKILEWSRKRLPPKPKDLEELEDFHIQLKTFKDLLKKNSEPLELFFLSKDQSAHDWKIKFESLYDSIIQKYDRYSGLSYTDLELLVYKGLKNEEVAKSARNLFEYFIVDEFQDTSFIQYEILLCLRGDNKERLLCVGDLKQAIYGFRGGEVGVFLRAIKDLDHRLPLQHNFRSNKKIIDFNNAFFAKILDLGEEVFEDQKVPEGVQEGLIERIILDQSTEDLSSAQVEIIEAKSIVKCIKKKSLEEVAVLYRKLAPSQYLIKELIKNNIGFSAQIKIGLMDDPMIGLFYCFLEAQLNRSILSMDLLRHQCDIYAQNLGLKKQDWESLHQNFVKNQRYYGLWQAWIMLLFDWGLTISTASKNLKYLENLILTQGGKVQGVLLSLKNLQEYRYSMKFQWGENPENIQLMTVHASKGLEFEHVFLAGVHTNGRGRNQASSIGKNPGSYVWFEKNQKKKWKTPQYILEDIVEKIKEKNESLRLLYVACTRAVKGLYWIDFVSETQNLSSNSLDWISFLRDLPKDLILDSIYDKCSFDHGSSLGAPLHYMDEIGVGPNNNTGQSSFLFMPELNTTILSSIAICHRKFYLESILKFDPGDAAVFEKLVPSQAPENESGLGVSSAQRGEKIHRMIEAWLLKKPEGSEIEKYPFYEWLAEHLDISSSGLQTELEIKFSFFGQMINGRIDLFIPGEFPRVIDFKTGQSSSIYKKSYWLQLKLYALALYELGYIDYSQTLSLELLYLDQKHQEKLPIRFENLKSQLWKEIIESYDPDQMNLDYCPECPYKAFCYPKSK